MKLLKSPLLQFALIYALALFALGLVRPPIPGFVMNMYRALLFAALLLYVSSDEERFKRFYTPILDTLSGRTAALKAVRLVLFILFPLGAGTFVFQKLTPQYLPPAESRTIHPEPPLEITFKGRPFNIQGLANPLREDKENLPKHITEGQEIYFKNCFYCHGDNLDGNGPFAGALNPIPANFRDAGTIAQLQESFVFWRVSLGWRGLPSGGKPWNSAMPAWEDTLTEDEIWKAILFIYDASGYQPRTWEAAEHEHASGGDARSRRHAMYKSFGMKSAYAEPTPAEPAAPASAADSEVKILYDRKCSGCHGVNGDGHGPAREFIYPVARDFTRGLYKIRHTKEGMVPSDEDLFLAIAKGLAGTTMPGWRDSLTEKQMKDLVAYIKAFSPRFSDSKPEAIPVVAETPSTPESLTRGKQLYEDIECWKCHGREGLADGPSAKDLKDDWGERISPANLSKPWNFRRGHSAQSIFTTLYTGIQGTPMPAFAESVEKPEDLWDVARYVETLSMEPKSKPATLLLAEFSTQLPTTLDDPQWDKVTYSRFPLLGQMVIPPRNTKPANDSVSVKAFHDGKSIAFLLEWHDPTLSDPKTPIEPKPGTDSSAPPAPPAPVFADRAALQFPETLMKGMEKPHFVMGDPQKAVNLWSWDSESKEIGEYTANGVGTWVKQEKQDVTGSQSYLNGRYKVVFTRPLQSDDEIDLDFPSGEYIPVGFLTWDGSQGETEGKCSLSAWYHLMLKEKPSKKSYAYSVLFGLLALAAEVWVAKRTRG
ncbi:MAG: c-type cytochrome [Nitrospirae bacterium]|nr:c-type cytochrome [Nitrospirota bacterium]